MIQQSIFVQYTPKSNFLLDDSFLDLQFAFDFNDRSVPEPYFDSIHESQQNLLFEPFPSDLNQTSNFPSHHSNDLTVITDQLSQQHSEIKNYNEKPIAKSKKTKNMCFNICQKTVKVMKSRVYDQKLQEISSQFGLSSQKVISKMLRMKKDLTGPKALQMFIDTNDGVSHVFKRFMRWFLEEKYFRHAIKQGTMCDLKGYLEFKNKVILNLLQG